MGEAAGHVRAGGGQSPWCTADELFNTTFTKAINATGMSTVGVLGPAPRGLAEGVGSPLEVTVAAFAEAERMKTSIHHALATKGVKESPAYPFLLNMATMEKRGQL